MSGWRETSRRDLLRAGVVLPLGALAAGSHAADRYAPTPRQTSGP